MPTHPAYLRSGLSLELCLSLEKLSAKPMAVCAQLNGYLLTSLPLSVFCWRYGSDRLKATHLRATCPASFCLSSNLRSYRAPSSRSANTRPAWRTTSSRGAPFLLFHPWPPRVTDPRLSKFACYIRSGLPRTRRL